MEKCEGCLLRRRLPDKPAVAAPLSSDFGQVLAFDLKVWDMHKNIYIFYMIDHFTRFQVATVIKSKEPEEIIKAFTTKWLPVFGKVDKILTDNGGEFSNENMREVASALNVQLLTTGANSPWQNGNMEKNHGLTDSIVKATRRDFPKMLLDVALAWAITAVNSMSSVRGFSPYQLVFGRQIKLPNILDDPPPAWEEPERSKSLLETLEALHSARVEFTKNERCERLRRALKAKIRIADTIYENGDLVYFRKEGEDKWKGPAKVVFQDSKVIFIRMGGTYYRVSANRLLKAGEALTKQLIEEGKHIPDETAEEQSDKKKTEDNSRHTINNQSESNIELDNQEPVGNANSYSNQNDSDGETIEQELEWQWHDRDSQNTNRGRTRTNTVQQTAEEDIDTTSQNRQQDQQRNESDIQEQEASTEQHAADNHDTETISNESDQVTIEPEQVTIEPQQVANETEQTDNTTTTNVSKGKKRKKVNQRPLPAYNEDGTLQNASQVLKRRDRIEILENGKWEKGTILSHGGKVGGRNAGWYNIELDNGDVFHDEVSTRNIRYEEQPAQEEDEVLLVKLDSGKKLKITEINNRKIRMEDEDEVICLLVSDYNLWNGFASQGRKWEHQWWQRRPGGRRGKCGRVLREQEHPDASFLGSRGGRDQPPLSSL